MLLPPLFHAERRRAACFATDMFRRHIFTAIRRHERHAILSFDCLCLPPLQAERLDGTAMPPCQARCMALPLLQLTLQKATIIHHSTRSSSPTTGMLGISSQKLEAV